MLLKYLWSTHKMFYLLYFLSVVLYEILEVPSGGRLNRCMSSVFQSSLKDDSVGYQTAYCSVPLDGYPDCT